MIRFIAKLEKQNKTGGWTYLIIPGKLTQQLKPGFKGSFRVKGTLDLHVFTKTSILPDGKGNFVLPFNAQLRKITGKKAGDKIRITMELDESRLSISKDLLVCLQEDNEALKFFRSLSLGMQYYYSQWVESAKTSPTKAKRIVTLVNGLSKRLPFTELMKEYKNAVA